MKQNRIWDGTFDADGNPGVMPPAVPSAEAPSEVASPVGSLSTGDLLAARMQTALVFAARYAHNRETGAAMAVVRALESCWNQLNAHTKAQILAETHDATCNHAEWERLRSFAANTH